MNVKTRSKVVTVEERKRKLEDMLRRIVAVLVDKYEPEKIILFGSLATGRIREDSDIDLLIIKETSKRPLERTMDITAMLNYPRVAMDIFVYTQEELDYLIKQGSQFIAEILEQGKVLYERDK